MSKHEPGEEIMVLAHEATPGYKPVLIVIALLLFAYLAVMFTMPAHTTQPMHQEAPQGTSHDAE